MNLKLSSLLAVLFAICLNYSFGQTTSDSISIKKVFGGYKFYQGERKLSMSELVKIVQPNVQAFKEIKSAQSASTFATIIGGAGGALVGWPIGTAVGGGKANWVLAGIGAGLIIASIPISQSFNRHSKQAVSIFNNGLKTNSFWNKNELKFSLTEDGIGLTLKF
jgi:hypothetical protein